MVYRELFPRALTARDTLDGRTLGANSSMSHLAARDEVRAVIDTLLLPINEGGRRRANTRAEWLPALKELPEGEEFFAVRRGIQPVASVPKTPDL